MWCTFKLLAILWLILSIIYFWAEHLAQPEIYEGSFVGFCKSCLWVFVKCIDDPGGIAPPAPVSIVGMVVANIIGFMGIVIFAVPAGLIGSGFVDVMNEERHEEDLKKHHQIMQKSFKVQHNPYLKKLLHELPESEKTWCADCNFAHLPNSIPVSKFLLNGIEMKDIIEVCKKYPDFRVKDESQAKSADSSREDRFILEHFPTNSSYGCCINRNSKVTIISTSSWTEVGTGYFAYYLAKFAGFNYISRDIVSEQDNFESFYNDCWSDTSQKRENFIKDLKGLCKDEGSWCICILGYLKHQDSKCDIHLAHALADGSGSTIIQEEDFRVLLSKLQYNMNKNFKIILNESNLFPLIKEDSTSFRNIGYKLQEDGCKCNVFTLRISSYIMQYDARLHSIIFQLAKTIHDVIEPQHLLTEENITDMNRPRDCYGYQLPQ